jgi:hypothetical protein
MTRAITERLPKPRVIASTATQGQDNCSARVLEQIGLQSNSVDLATPCRRQGKGPPSYKKSFSFAKGRTLWRLPGSVRPGKQWPPFWRSLTKER